MDHLAMRLCECGAEGRTSATPLASMNELAATALWDERSSTIATSFSETE